MAIQITKKQKNIFWRTNNWFTLVELIIVITILAILATIAFISFKNYSGSARNANKLTTLQNIEKALQLYVLKTGNYTEPDWIYWTWLYSDTLLSQVWFIWESISKKININKSPKDPLVEYEYTYWLSGNKKYYQLWTALENWGKNYDSKVIWNYKGLYKFKWSDANNYIINLPSLLFTEEQENWYDFSQSLSKNPKFVINNGGNLVKPYDENNTETITWTLLKLTQKDNIFLSAPQIWDDEDDFTDLEDILGYDKEEIKKEILWEKYIPKEENNSESEIVCQANNPTDEAFFKFDATTKTIIGWNAAMTPPQNLVIPCDIWWVNVEHIWTGALTIRWWIKSENIYIPNNIKTIWNWAFQWTYLQVSSIKTITFQKPSQLEVISNSAFGNLNSVKNIEIPKSVKYIWENAFLWTWIEYLTFEKNAKIEEIWERAFHKNNIKNLEIPKSLQQIWKRAFQEAGIENLTFQTWSQLINIWDYSFRWNNLHILSLPSVEYIGEQAFLWNQLTEVTLLSGNKSTYISDYAFQLNNITKVHFWKSIKTIWYGILLWNPDLNSVIFEEWGQLEVIGVNAFANAKLTQIVIPSSVKKIEVWAFQDNAIETVVFHNNSMLEEIWVNVFYKNNLESITIPSSVQSIGSSAFSENGPQRESNDIMKSWMNAWNPWEWWTWVLSWVNWIKQ